MLPPSSRGLGHFPFTEVTGIRIPLGVLNIKVFCTDDILILDIYVDVYLARYQQKLQPVGNELLIRVATF